MRALVAEHKPMAAGALRWQCRAISVVLQLLEQVVVLIAKVVVLATQASLVLGYRMFEIRLAASEGEGWYH